MTLYDIAKTLSIKRGGVSDAAIARYILFGKDALMDMSKLGHYAIKSVAIDIDSDTYSCKLPSDYRALVSVGICVCGRIIEIDYDDTLCIRENTSYCSDSEVAQRAYSDCCCVSEGKDLGYGYYMWEGITCNGEMLQPMYSYPAYHSKVLYKIHNGRIYIDSTCYNVSQVVLMYKSDGSSEQGSTHVDKTIESVVEAYILWQDELYSKNISAGKAETYKREWKRRKDLLTYESVLSSTQDMLKTMMKHTYMANIGR